MIPWRDRPEGFRRRAAGGQTPLRAIVAGIIVGVLEM